MWITCPECGTKLEVPDDHPVRPFCSTRCKLLDLSHWFNEEHHVVAQPSPDADDPEAAEGVPKTLTVDLDRFRIPDA